MAEVKLKNIKKIYPLASDEKKNKKNAKNEQKKTNLQITKDGVVAVQEFSLDIKDKEFIVLVGPSGCGKSTTLRMIAGLEDISGGELYIDDKLCNDVEPKDRDIAMVFQNYALYPHMTVYENMAFPLEICLYIFRNILKMSTVGRLHQHRVPVFQTGLERVHYFLAGIEVHGGYPGPLCFLAGVFHERPLAYYHIRAALDRLFAHIPVILGGVFSKLAHIAYHENCAPLCPAGYFYGRSH